MLKLNNMNSKKQKFLSLAEFYTALNEHHKSRFLIVQVNNSNMIERTLIDEFCQVQNIQSFKLKLNLLKKLSSNQKFLNLFAGPTRIYLFSDFNQYLNFLQVSYITKKLIPLAVY